MLIWLYQTCFTPVFNPHILPLDIVQTLYSYPLPFLVSIYQLVMVVRYQMAFNIFILWDNALKMPPCIHISRVECCCCWWCVFLVATSLLWWCIPFVIVISTTSFNHSFACWSNFLYSPSQPTFLVEYCCNGWHGCWFIMSIMTRHMVWADQVLLM